MEKNKKGRSIKYWLVTPMLLVIGLQAVIYFAAVGFGGTFTHMREGAYHGLSSNTASIQSELEQNLNTVQTNVISYAARISEQLQQYAANREIDLSSQEDIDNYSAELIMQADSELISLMRSTTTTGAFLILENGDVKKPGLYLRDLDPHAISYGNDDLLGIVGPSKVLKSEKIALDTEWYPRFDFQKISTTDFYDIPYEAGVRYPDRTAGELSYWTGFSQLARDGIRFISYSLPLQDQEGDVYGVLGISISEAYLLSILDYQELNLGEYGAVALCSSQEDAECQVELVSGTIMKRELGAVTHLKQSLIKGQQKVSQIKADHVKEKMVGTLCPLDLYGGSDMEMGRSWMVVGIADNAQLMDGIKDLSRSLLISFVIALVVGVMVAMQFSHMVLKPVELLMNSLRTSDPAAQLELERVNVNEIDELAAAMEEQSRNVAESASRLSQVIEMVGMPIGALEYNLETGVLRCTDGVYDILNFSESFRKKGKKDQAWILSEFEVFQTRIVEQRVAEDQANVVAFYVDDRKRWVRFQEQEYADTRVVVVQDVTKETEELEKLEYERDYDVLTRLLNRRAFKREAAEMIEEGEYPVLAAAMWDLDNLKFINDTYGHDYGDRYIQEAARIFGELRGKGALVCRRSGDEFIALLYRGHSREEYYRMVEEVHEKLAKNGIHLPTGEEIRLRASGGIAYYPEDAPDYASLMKYVDFAMYTSKHNAKGSLQEFDPEVYERDALLVSGTEALNRFLEQRAVRYAFQPIVDTVTGEVFAYEALMRPQISEFRSPAEALRLAREQSKLYQVEQLTWYGALQDYTSQVPETDGRKLFINSLPNTHLLQKDYEQLEEQYQPYMSRIVVEMIESEEQDPESMQCKQQCREQWGSQVALDDYGAGYSTEGALLSIRPDYVKLDISIIAGIHCDPDRQTIVRNILRFSGPRGIKVIAEGVETKDEMEFLVKSGVNYLQGYYLAKPDFMVRDIPEERKQEIRECRK